MPSRNQMGGEDRGLGWALLWGAPLGWGVAPLHVLPQIGEGCLCGNLEAGKIWDKPQPR